MKSLIDIYESLLTKTSIKKSSVKDEIDFLSLKQFDEYKYMDMFNLEKLEKTIFVFSNPSRTSSDTVLYHIEKSLEKFSGDPNVVKFYRILFDIVSKYGTIVDSWWYYYKDGSAETCDVKVLKPAFKHGKQYKGYTPTQEKQRSLSKNFFEYLDDSELYMPLYKDGYVWWIIIPKGVSSEEYELLKNYMTLLAKYNK